MKRVVQTVGAVAVGALLVMATAMGGVMLTNPTVNSADGAADELVQRGEGQVALGAGILVGAAAVYTYDNYIKNSPDTTDLAKADALETKKEIYDQVSIQNQNNQLTDTAYSNYLNDTETIALMEGKNAYIRALENGSAESVARNAAIQAVADYYATKQVNILSQFEVNAIVTNSSRFTAENTTGMNKTFIQMNRYASGDGNSDGHPIANESLDVENTTATLVNSSSHEFTSVNITLEGEAVNSVSPERTSKVISPTHEKSWLVGTYSGDSYTHNVTGFTVRPPDSNYDPINYYTVAETQRLWQQVEQQNNDVQAQLDTFINNTYSSYQQGDINTSDLVDPYLSAREYSAQNSSQFQTWGLRTLSSLGVNPPQNLSNIGRMTVVSGSVTYDGILMSDENPSGGFTVGQTYNASDLNGSQFVALEDGDLHKLQGTFTLESAETAQGDTIETNESIEYNSINYQTSNTSEFKALQEDLDALSAEINARQQTLRNSGGTGLLPGLGSVGTGGLIGIVVAAGGAAFVLGRD